MRVFLTFLCVLLLAGRVEAATVSAPTIVEISPSTPPTSPLYITNVFKNLSNNMVIRLLPGTHTITVFPGANNLGRDAHLRLLLKTNITIEGLGPQSVIFHGQTGTVFNVSLCENITFKNFSIIGTRPTDFLETSLIGTFNLETNKHLVWDGITFKNQFGHNIASLETKDGDYHTVKNCLFDTCANTNAWPPSSGYPGDGACIMVAGNHMQILNNVFTNCGLCIEFEGLSASGHRNTLISGNTFLAGLEPYIINYDTGPGEDGRTSDVIIHNNTFKYTAGHGISDQKYPIQLSQMERYRITGNHFEGATYGVYHFASFPVTGGTISDNTFKDIALYGIVVGGSDSVTSLLIQGNYFTNVAGDGVLLGANVTRSVVTDNIFDNVCDHNLGFGMVRLQGDSNTVVRNTFIRQAPGSTATPISIFSGADWNKVADNDIWHWGGAPFTDAGANNLILPNIIAGALNGALPKTNTFTGTNVPIDLSRYPVQVVVVTNTCLLIITNTVSTALHSGKQVTVTLYNPKTTNVGVFVTAANRRLLGPDSGLLSAASAAAHISLTNGQSMRIDYQVDGTNYAGTVFHQR